jgi:predicted dehydrogenase
MGLNHVRVLRSIPSVEFVGVYDQMRERIEGLGAGAAANSLEELFERAPDYCVVATPTDTHESLAVQCIARGINVLIEKPLAPSSKSAQAVLTALSQSTAIGAVGHIERFNSGLRKAKELIDSGAIGRVFQVSTIRQGPYPGRIADVGVIRDLATHDLDLTSWICGSQYSTVMAHTSRRSGREHEDMLTMTASLESGVLCNHVVNWLSPYKERSVTILGEFGAYVVSTLTSDVTFFANGVIVTEWDKLANFRGVTEGDVIRYAIPKREPLLVEHEEFINALRGAVNTSVLLDQAARIVRVAEAVELSANTGESVHLDWEME